MERPEQVVRTVCSSVGLAFDPELGAPTTRVPVRDAPRAPEVGPLSTSDEWRGQVGELEAEIVEERCGELAAALGYGAARGHRAGPEPRALASAPGDRELVLGVA